MNLLHLGDPVDLRPAKDGITTRISHAAYTDCIEHLHVRLQEALYWKLTMVADYGAYYGLFRPAWK